MATKGKIDRPIVIEETSTPDGIAVEMVKGSVSVVRDGLRFSLSGKNLRLRKESPLSLSIESGEVEYDDGALTVKAEGESINLQLDG
jgi:hypothetical protein